MASDASTPSNSPTSSIRSASPSPSVSTSKSSTHSCKSQSRRLRAPYPLIANTNCDSLPPTIPSDHASIYFARQMSLIHNTIIRALNAAHYHCTTFISEEAKSPDSMTFVDPNPDLKHIADFLEYNRLVFMMLDHHHHVEEEYMFPQIEDLLLDIGVPRGSMQRNVAQHQAFEAGLRVFEAYVFRTQPTEFQPHTLLHIIESFAANLVEHLHDEIPTLLALHVLKDEDLMKIWKRAEYEATKDDDMYTSLPFVLGCQDANFELDGEVRPFPPISRAIRPALILATDLWFSRRKAGVWRFLPCNTPKAEERCSSSASSKFHENF